MLHTIFLSPTSASAVIEIMRFRTEKYEERITNKFQEIASFCKKHYYFIEHV